MKGIILLTIIGVALAAPSGRNSKPCLCELLVDEVRGLISEQDSQEKIFDYVSDMCLNLGVEDKDICRTMIGTYSGILIDTLTSHLTAQEVCKLLPDVCPGMEEEVEAPPAVLEVPPVEVQEPQGPLECELCKLIMVGVDKLIGTNRSEEAINATLEKFCASLPASISSLCFEIEPKILDALKNGIDPDTACKLAALCLAEVETFPIPCDICLNAIDAIGVKDPNSVCIQVGSCTEEAYEPEPVIEEPEPETNSVVEETEPAENYEETNVQNAVECQLCKFLVHAIDKLVGENKTVASVNATLYEFCNKLPGELKDTCLQIEPEILKAILGGIDPTVACDFVKACKDTSLSSMYITCDVCKETLGGVAGQRGLAVCSEMKGICEEEEKNPVINQSTVFPPVVDIGDDAKCELCKFVIEMLDRVVENNATMAKINVTLFDICKAVPKEDQGLHSPAFQCFISKEAHTELQYSQWCALLIPQIEMIIAHGFNPTNTCLAVNFCEKSLDEEKKPASVLSPVGDDVECEVCKIVISALDDILEENASIAQINATLFAICKALPKEFQKQCATLIPKIDVILEHGFDPTNTCIAVNLCQSIDEMKSFDLPLLTCDICKTVSERMIPKHGGDICLKSCHGRRRRSIADNIADNMERWQNIASTIQQFVTNDDKLDEDFLGCELCKIVIRLVDEIAGENASLQTVNQTLEEICTRLTGDQLVQMCLKEAPKLLVFMKNGIEPGQVCKAAKMCTPEQSDVVEEASDDVEPSFYDILNNKGIQAAENMDEPNDLKCDLCKEVIKFVDSYLEENATDEKINQTLYQICQSLPSGTLQDLCLQEAPVIMDAITKGGFDPDKACALAKLCSEDNAIEEAAIYIEPEELMLNLDEPNDLKCDLCQEVIKFVDSRLADNATDEKINQTLEQICQSLPSGALQDLCMQEIPEIMKVVESGGFDPEKACEAARLCEKGVKNKKKTDIILSKDFEEEKKTGDLKDLKCEICEAVIDEIDAVLEENATIAKINETVFNLCNRLIGALQDVCLNVAPKIVAEIAGGADYKMVCGKMGLCAENLNKMRTLTYNFPEPEEEKPENLKDLKCDICRAIIDEVDTVLGENKTAAKVNETVYNLCDRAGTLKDVCYEIAPMVVKEIVAGADPKTTCTKINLCAGSAKDFVLEMEQTVETPSCDACVKTMNVVYNNMQNDYPKFQPVLAGLCQRLPEQYQNMCGVFLEKDHGLHLKKFLEQVNPEVLCEAMECHH